MQTNGRSQLKHIDSVSIVITDMKREIDIGIRRNKHRDMQQIV